jgi:hypothetical protein
MSPNDPTPATAGPDAPTANPDAIRLFAAAHGEPTSSFLTHPPGGHKMRHAPSGKYDAHEKQEEAPLRTLAAGNAHNTNERENNAQQRDENAGAKICGARLLVSCAPSLDQIVERRNVGLATTATATTQANLCDALAAKPSGARLAIGNRVNSRMVVTLHSVCVVG